MKTEELAQLAIDISRLPFDSDTPTADILQRLMDVHASARHAALTEAAETLAKTFPSDPITGAFDFEYDQNIYDTILTLRDKKEN